MSENAHVIYEAFAATEYGRILAGRVRYERYNLAGVPNAEWVGLLGADVNNLTHMPLTRGLVRAYVKTTENLEPGYFSEQESLLLDVAALIHDQAEAKVGDKTFGNKTDADEAEEQQQLIANLDSFAPGMADEIKHQIVQARDEIVFDSTTKLGVAFNNVERAGYVRTALRAARHLAEGSAGESHSGLRWLVGDVFSNQITVLTERASDYPAVAHYLAAQATEITAAMDLVDVADYDHDGDKAETKRAQFAAALAAWGEWRVALNYNKTA